MWYLLSSIGFSRESSLISTYLWIFLFSFCYWFLVSFHYYQKRYFVWFQPFKIYEDFFYGLSEVTQSCLTLCDPMDCSLLGSFIHGTFQARILEWVAISFWRRSSRPRDWTWVSRIVGRRFTVWAITYGLSWWMFHIHLRKHVFCC